ncbi:hypothetical protein M8494_01140 [Serratia ureilytica]
MVTNQSGIARGKFSEDQFVPDRVDGLVAGRSRRVDFDGIYFGPHHPEAVVEEYRQVCGCRKPQPGMLQAQQELNIDMAASYMVGDKPKICRRRSCRRRRHQVLVRTGKLVTEQGEKLTRLGAK